MKQLSKYYVVLEDGTYIIESSTTEPEEFKSGPHNRPDEAQNSADYWNAMLESVGDLT